MNRPLTGPSLAISQLALADHRPAAIVEALGDLAVDGIEVLPTLLWPNWGTATLGAAQDFARILDEAGLRCPSLQSILFGLGDLQLFGSSAVRGRLRDHLLRVAELGEVLGAKSIVFGSPKNRLRGNLTLTEAMARATDFFTELSERLYNSTVAIALEPNPVQYGADFLTSLPEAVALVKAVDSSHCRVQLDTSTQILRGGDPTDGITEAMPHVVHVHASEPFLGAFDSPHAEHAVIASSLSSWGWDRWISVEMKSPMDGMVGVRRAVRFVREAYLT